jgi:hypothetical protein
MHDNFLKRQPHHLGRGLSNDRIAPRSDIGHVGLDRHDTATIQSGARA